MDERHVLFLHGTTEKQILCGMFLHHTFELIPFHHHAEGGEPCCEKKNEVLLPMDDYFIRASDFVAEL